MPARCARSPRRSSGRSRLAGGPSPLHIEGLDDVRWVLLDYGDFVIHVFLDEVRRFYDLERLWADAEQWTWERSGAVLAAGERGERPGRRGARQEGAGPAGRGTAAL